jgi:hypothetical protein
MQMNIPATLGPICFSGSLEENLNVYGRTPSDGNSSPDPNFSRTTGWIGTILGRNVPDKVLINCCYFLFRSVIQYGCQGPSLPLIG